ncbi:amidase [Mariniluteicoccus endophyticus]
MTEPCDLTADELSRAYAAGDLTPDDTAASVLARIDEREPELNALWILDRDRLLADARAATLRWRGGTPRSAYDGVPVTIKENIARAGWPMPAGTALEPRVPENNAPITDRLLEAGCVIVGATTMPDWGMLSSGVSSRHGITRNALDPHLTAGGSSAGAGTAAAAGYGPLHVGSDIGGSIRLPATWQGLASLKPSEGLVPLDVPYLARAAGPLARRVDDVAALMEVIAVADPRDFTARPYPAVQYRDTLDPRGLRVGVQLDPGPGLPLDPGVAAVVERALGRLSDAGAVLERVGPFLTEPVLGGIDGFWRTRSLADLRRLAGGEQDLVLPWVRRWAEGGTRFDGPATVENYQRFAELARVTRARTEAYDLIVSPVCQVAAFSAEDPMPFADVDLPMQHISYTLPHNASGQPAGTVDIGALPDGRRVGLQVAAPIGADGLVVAALRWFETT